MSTRRLSYTASGFILGCTLTGGLLLNLSEAQTRLFVEQQNAYKVEAVNDFVNQGHWKELALSDQDFTRNVCNAWWFGLTGKDRKLKKDSK